MNARYEENLYKSVIKWCSLELSDYVKDILQKQKSSGECRFWLVFSKDSKTGVFAWEEADLLFPKNKLKKLKEELDKESHDIKTKCQSKKDKHLEIQPKDWSAWEVNSTNWNNSEEHKKAS